MVEIAQGNSRQSVLAARGSADADWDRVSVLMLLCGLAAIFLPTYWDLAYGRHAASAQGHEIVVFGVSTWLLWRKRASIMEGRAAPRAGWPMVVFGVIVYVVGRSQQLVRVETLAPILVLVGTLLCMGGWAALRSTWFALFFLLFSVPLSFNVEHALTAPLKEIASMRAAWALQAAGYPVGRSGVVITIGQYQLLVAKACAGLHTMFTLEAMGLLYLNLMSYKSWLRNVTLGLLILPISVTANVMRVILISLVTYHFGDAAGQGFTHDLAGIVLFALALALIITTDAMLGRLLPRGRRQ